MSSFLLGPFATCHHLGSQRFDLKTLATKVSYKRKVQVSKKGIYFSIFFFVFSWDLCCLDSVPSFLRAEPPYLFAMADLGIGGDTLVILAAFLSQSACLADFHSKIGTRTRTEATPRDSKVSPKTSHNEINIDIFMQKQKISQEIQNVISVVLM